VKIHPAGELLWRGSPLSAELPGARFVRVRPGETFAERGLFVVLEGEGSIRVGDEAFTLPRLSAVTASEPAELFNEGEEETLWLIVCTSPATTTPTG
jgi:hypothetical protein